MSIPDEHPSQTSFGILSRRKKHQSGSITRFLRHGLRMIRKGVPSSITNEYRLPDGKELLLPPTEGQQQLHPPGKRTSVVIPEGVPVRSLRSPRRRKKGILRAWRFFLRGGYPKGGSDQDNRRTSVTDIFWYALLEFLWDAHWHWGDLHPPSCLRKIKKSEDIQIDFLLNYLNMENFKYI